MYEQIAALIADGITGQVTPGEAAEQLRDLLSQGDTEEV